MNTSSTTGAIHQSVINHPELKERSFAVYSFGKTLHITGWRVGYCVAPSPLTSELRKVHQFNTFSIAAPLQAAIGLYLERHPDAWREVAGFFSAKRDLLLSRLAGSGLDLPPAAGSYFQLAGYGALGDGIGACTDVEFTERLINEAGVAVIPLSPFYREPPRDMRYRAPVRRQARRDSHRRGRAHSRLDRAGRARMSFRVTLAQQPLAWHDAPANRAHFAGVLAPLKGETDLVVLPEMFTSGFTMKPEQYAEDADGETRAWLLAQAAQLDAAVGGSVAINDRGRYFNRFMLATPDGRTAQL